MICHTFSCAVPYSSASCRLRQGTALRAAPDSDAGGGNRGRRGRWKDTRSRDRQWPIWGTTSPLSVHAWCLSRKTPVSRRRSTPPAEGAGAGVREWRHPIHPGARARRHNQTARGPVTPPRRTRCTVSRPRCPACRVARRARRRGPSGCARGPAHPCTPPGRQASPSACSARQASPMIWQPKRPPAEAGFSFSPWTNSTASRHNQGSPECVVIADTAECCHTHVPAKLAYSAVSLPT